MLYAYRLRDRFGHSHPMDGQPNRKNKEMKSVNGQLLTVTRRQIVSISLGLLINAAAFAQESGEWTGRGWVGPSSGSVPFFWVCVIVLAIFWIIQIIDEGFPNLFPTIGGLVLISVVAQICVGILQVLGADLADDDLFIGIR